MNQPVVYGAQGHQIAQIGVAALGPVRHMVGAQVASRVAAGKLAGAAVPLSDRSQQRGAGAARQTLQLKRAPTVGAGAAALSPR